MKDQLFSLDEYACTQVFPISLFWLVNHRKIDNVDLANKFIIALLNADLTLYYINDDFDSPYYYVQFPLCKLMAKTLVNYVAFSGECLKSVDAENVIDNEVTPIWFTERIRLRLADEPVIRRGETDIDGLEVTVGSLFIKCIDIEKACELQGISTFYWPCVYPMSNSTESIRYTLQIGGWKCRTPIVSRSRNDGERRLSCVHNQRIDCLMRALQTHFGKSKSLGVKNEEGKFPQIKQIYRMVRNEPAFATRGALGAAPISLESFKQAWKGIYGEKLKAHFYGL